MKEYSTQNIRNIALASHSGSGKTMLAESLLFFSGAITRLGEIEIIFCRRCSGGSKQAKYYGAQ